MSIRSERSLENGISGLDLNGSATHAILTAPSQMANDHVNATISAAQNADSALGEANNLSTNHPEHPLKRTVVATIRASLGDLCLRKQKATWSPSPEALKSILQQKRFTSLSGTAEQSGDLKSIVLHNLALTSVSSDFKIPVGMKVTGVDNDTYSITGESFSHIVGPNATSTTPKILQEDDVALAYEFSRKFPGYTADNLTEKGIHEVQQRRFCLVAADHPIVSAISENAERLQMGDISMMPEGLVKIGTDLYQTILPMVQQQVSSQIKVRDLSAAKMTISPADATSWQEARTELLSEAKTALRSELETALSAAGSDADLDSIKGKFTKKELTLEHDIDSKVHTFSATIDVTYNFLAK